MLAGFGIKAETRSYLLYTKGTGLRKQFNRLSTKTYSCFHNTSVWRPSKLWNYGSPASQSTVRTQYKLVTIWGIQVLWNVPPYRWVRVSCRFEVSQCLYSPGIKGPRKIFGKEDIHSKRRQTPTQRHESCSTTRRIKSFYEQYCQRPFFKRIYSAVCYNEQFLSIKSGCYNESRCYNERGGIPSANEARAYAWRVGPSRFD